jgi:hypothetical protein
MSFNPDRVDFGRLSGGLPDLSNVEKGIAEMGSSGGALQECVRSLSLLGIAADANLAEAFYDRLNNQIKLFDEELDQDHEVGIKLASFGQAISVHVSELGYHNPSLIFFYGETENGERVQLIQHVNQINFLLIAMPKAKPDEPKRPFGFEAATSGQASGPDASTNGPESH